MPATARCAVCTAPSARTKTTWFFCSDNQPTATTSRIDRGRWSACNRLRASGDRSVPAATEWRPFFGIGIEHEHSKSGNGGCEQPIDRLESCVHLRSVEASRAGVSDHANRGPWRRTRSNSLAKMRSTRGPAETSSRSGAARWGGRANSLRVRSTSESKQGDSLCKK